MNLEAAHFDAHHKSQWRPLAVNQPKRDGNIQAGTVQRLESAPSAVRSSSPVPVNGAVLPLHVGSLPGLHPLALETREADNLRLEVQRLKRDLAKSGDTITRLRDREKLLTDRLSEYAQRQIQRGTRFEDLSLGDNRPTQLVRRYGNLYSETRLDACDALDDLEEMEGLDDLKGKLLFSVVVLSFRSVQHNLTQLKRQISQLLFLGDDTESAQMEDTIALYLRKTSHNYNIRPCMQEVSEQVYTTLYDYPSLRSCQGLHTYIRECCVLCWALVLQHPPLLIDYDHKTFCADKHTRFHTSDPQNATITSVIWPALTEGSHGECVYKGVVTT